ncbi:hypothetical protein EUGRSUZ_I02337 [Eucalyptus grandis]|uniref:SAM-dependent methyltransferase RsmB-F/NOP2-type catalytic core domain-containing protein n=2 Tax=Eucalyptus grandis TaxID=71139 RepID=A0A059AS75_EUCGR|nr:hypothetical protein EUGRSUZ_I02337 [Eucalyptus grandis]
MEPAAQGRRFDTNLCEVHDPVTHQQREKPEKHKLCFTHKNLLRSTHCSKKMKRKGKEMREVLVAPPPPPPRFPMDGAPAAPLPREFLDFLGENGLDPSIYAAGDRVPRYVRVKPGSESCLRELEGELACEPETVDWLPGFYSLPPRVQIAGTKAYREGKLYGIDAASGAAVLALSIAEGDHVLDLCAAPGAKLCMMLDALGDSGSVTGVDVSEHRLAACRTMLQKYAIGDWCRLFVADGTTFSVSPARVHSYKSCKSTTNEKAQTFQEWTSRRPWKERKRAAKARQSATSKSRLGFQYPEIIFYGKHSGVVGLIKDDLYRTVSDNELLNCGYDKVLVDAECTHDGSIRHIQKFEQWGWETLQQRVLNAERTDNLTLLQVAESWWDTRLQHLQFDSCSK